MRKIKSGDNVIVMRGKDAGKTGEVLKVIRQVRTKKGQRKMEPQMKVVVKGVNIVKRSQKPNPTFNIPGGIITVEKPIDYSNVMLADAKDNKATRIGIKVDTKTGKKVRVTKKSKAEIK
jgi:large subunit ribosomal protein L24